MLLVLDRGPPSEATVELRDWTGEAGRKPLSRRNNEEADEDEEGLPLLLPVLVFVPRFLSEDRLEVELVRTLALRRTDARRAFSALYMEARC